MINEEKFDVIIVGGSYAGLSAAMALGRALRKVLVIDSGLPCNRQTPHSHNFLTQDGETPKDIAEKAKDQVLQYESVEFLEDIVVAGVRNSQGFAITTKTNREFQARKLIFATGVIDNMPNIKGFSECWGITAIHCPYCHGYEVRNESTGILANGDIAFHYAQLIRNWTKDLTIFTNGRSTLTIEQTEKIFRNDILIIEKEIVELKHRNGHLNEIVFDDLSTVKLAAIYSRPEFEQHCKIPEILGCELSENGLLKVDEMQKTNVDGVFACGDSANMLRSIANSVSTGNLAGAASNNEMTIENFF